MLGAPPEEFRLSNPQTKEKPEKDKKVRVFALAKELNLESKVLVDICKELGFPGITSQLNGLEPDQVDTLKERIKAGPKIGPVPQSSGLASAPPKPVIPPPSQLITKVQSLPKAQPRPAGKPPVVETPRAPAITTAPAVPIIAEPQPTEPPVSTHTLAAEEAAPAAPSTPEATIAPTPTAEHKAPEPAAPTSAPPQNIIPGIGSGGIRHLGGGVRNLNANRPSTPPQNKTTPPVAPTTTAAPAVRPPADHTPPPTVAAPVAPPAMPAKPATPTPPAAPSMPAATTGPVSPPRPTTPPASTAPTQPQSPPNVIPPHAGQQPRPSVLSRKPQPPPPAKDIIAGRRTSTGVPSGGGGQRPGGPSGQQGGPPRSGPSSQGGPPAGGAGPQQGQGQGQGRGQGQGGGARGSGAGAGGGGNKPSAGTPMKLTPEMIERLRNASARGQRMTLNDITKPQPAGAGPAPSRRGEESRSGPGSASRISGRPQQPVESGGEGGDDDEKKKAGGVIGRDSRHKGRTDRGRGRGPGSGQPAVVVGPGGQVDIIEQQWGSRKGPRQALLNKMKRRQQQQTIVKEGKIEIALPITVRSLSETIGMKVGELTKRLLNETEQLYGVNSTLEFDVASLIALEKNIELVAKKQETKEDVLLRRYKEMLENVDPEKLRPRPPIVTIMGHVDHGKTSLLDKIRQNYGLESDVVSTEAGGITQVIRAWSVKRDVIVEKDGQEVQEERRITFLDTPGHEAFTKMRARGANVTDIAVIVVAATDGVMPQTQEAISHAKAAEVDIIVAINKVDMPNANVERTRRQLYNEGLLPDDMGGDVQFVETSAATGQGISDLLDTIVLVAEVAELTADPDRQAAGTCLEAYMTSDEGVMATLLIQQGTLKRGDIVLCGSTYGRVRAMYSDLGRPIKQAGPSTPVRITGLDRVPNADDPFYVVGELTEAQEIAEIRQQKEQEAARVKFGPKSLDSIKEANTKSKITELKVILKAEARGSVEAIRKELEKLVHEEVRTRVLHAGIGAITESDVILALTSPDDTLVIGFNVTADDAALRLAEERGISLREYDIIYKLTDDVKAALEGKLKPVEEVVHLGRAVIRDTFKISKVGTIAGCYVTSGAIERSARVRVIREGVVIYPPSEKVVGLDSLKRFKDDVREVREGFECGMKITGFDDVKVNDVIEAFKIEIKHRTL